MSAEPLTREERDFILREPYRTGKESPGAAFSRYEASVQAAEEQRDQAENDRDVARLEANAAEERAERLRAALVPLKASHDALIASVTPPNCVDVPSDEYDALFSEWHAATRSCIAALAADAADDSARGDQ